jgi:hypothetical protein
MQNSRDPAVALSVLTLGLVSRGVAVAHIRASGDVELERELRDGPADEVPVPQLSLFAEPGRGA